MEHWIVYCDTSYDAVPWPFSKPWNEFVQSPLPLVHPCDDFGRVSPSDGLSEAPSVPAHLPRPMPSGEYRMAIYHDPEWLYVFLDARNGPIIVSTEEISGTPRYAGVNRTYPSVALMSRDQYFGYQFGMDANGAKTDNLGPAVQGGRQKNPDKRDLRWDFATVPNSNGELSCWRIARAGISNAIVGDSVRLAIARLNFETIEAVAWGTNTNWSPRPDEMGTVRLIDERATPPWPIVRRVELLYDPATEQGRFRVRVDAPYGKNENEMIAPIPLSELKESKASFLKYIHAVYRVRDGYPHQVAWDKLAFTLNNSAMLLDLTEEVETGEVPIANGINHVRVATTGGPATEFYFEKQSGNRVDDCPLPSKPVRSHEWVMKQLATECETAIRDSEAARELGPARPFRMWELSNAASLGRVYHYLKQDPRLLEAVRAEADYALTRQREDGTFAGFHLEPFGIKPSPWAGGAFDSGPAGELWVLAARLLKDDKYLKASSRLLNAYKEYRIEFNHNYAAFALYHLAEHYRLTHEPLALEHALHIARHCVAIDLLPLGMHAGHNYYHCYGSITLRGMSLLCSVLPVDDPYRATLRRHCVRMVNHLITRLQPDGLFDARDRFFLGAKFWSWGLFSVAFLLPRQDVVRLDAVIQRMLHTPDEHWGRSWWERLAESDFVRYWAHREKLLAGETINPMDLV